MARHAELFGKRATLLRAPVGQRAWQHCQAGIVPFLPLLLPRDAPTHPRVTGDAPGAIRWRVLRAELV